MRTHRLLRGTTHASRHTPLEEQERQCSELTGKQWSSSFFLKRARQCCGEQHIVLPHHKRMLAVSVCVSVYLSVWAGVVGRLTFGVLVSPLSSLSSHISAHSRAIWLEWPVLSFPVARPVDVAPGWCVGKDRERSAGIRQKSLRFVLQDHLLERERRRGVVRGPRFAP